MGVTSVHRSRTGGCLCHTMSYLLLKWEEGRGVSSGLKCRLNFSAEECGASSHLPTLDLASSSKAPEVRVQGNEYLCWNPA